MAITWFGPDSDDELLGPPDIGLAWLQSVMLTDPGIMFDGPETVAFDVCDIRSLDRGRRRLLWQFRNSCVLNQVLEAISLETQELIDACCLILTKRLLSDAEGVQLETIGELVGELKLSDISDDDYLVRIVAKVFRNQIKYASYPEIVRYIKLLTGTDVSFKRVAPLDVELIVPTDLTDAEILRLLSFVEQSPIAEQQYLVPVAATVRIVGARRKLAIDFFRPDRPSGRPDLAVVSATGFRV